MQARGSVIELLTLEACYKSINISCLHAVVSLSKLHSSLVLKQKSREFIKRRHVGHTTDLVVYTLICTG